MRNNKTKNMQVQQQEATITNIGTLQHGQCHKNKFETKTTAPKAAIVYVPVFFGNVPTPPQSQEENSPWH